MPSELQQASLVQNMRSAWFRTLGMLPDTGPPLGPFLGPIDTTISIQKGSEQSLCRIHASASMMDLYVAVSLLVGLDTEDFSLRTVGGLSFTSSSSLAARPLYGSTLHVHLVQNKHTNKTTRTQ